MTDRAHHRNLSHLDRMTPRAEVSVIASCDGVLRASAVFGVVMDDPRTVALFHDIDVEEGRLHRMVVDASGVVEDDWLEMEHACVSCAVREDAIPTLSRLVADSRWDHAVLALPVTAESLPAARALAGATHHDGPLREARLATVACLVEGSGIEDDLLGDASLAERGIALVEEDERVVGECVAAQLEHADLVVVAGDPDATGSDLIDALRGKDSRRLDGLHHLTTAMLRAGRHDAPAAERRCHPLHALHTETSGTGDLSSTPPGHVAPTSRAWMLHLHSDRPFHPERLLENIERLGSGRLRSRGVFWLPNRPDTMCLWDGAGGQLSIGALGTWDEVRHPRRTHLVFIGTGDERRALQVAFDQCLAGPDDVSDGGLAWLDREDVLEPWLGERQ